MESSAPETKPLHGDAALRTLACPAFDTYYKRNLGLDAADFAALEAVLRTPLPITFRFSGGSAALDTLRALAMLAPVALAPAPSCIFRIAAAAGPSPSCMVASQLART